MKIILRFLKPHWKLCTITILLTFVDVIGALIIPTYASEMLNLGTAAGTNFPMLLDTCIKMLIAAIISGAAMITASYASVTTRTVSDITNIQMALTNCFQMLFQLFLSYRSFSPFVLTG